MATFTAVWSSKAENVRKKCPDQIHISLVDDCDRNQELRPGIVVEPGDSDGVFHAPQNLEKGGHGISPCTV